MKEKIKIDDLLKKHSLKSTASLKKAMKEIVNIVIKKCSEEATAKIEREWEGNTGSEYYNDYPVVNKDSILKIKKMIDYGK